jgi:hypothetical protein
VYDEIGLRGPHTVFDGVSEIRRPCHPVSSREHWRATVRSGGQRLAALAAPPRHDGTAGAGTHTQPETVHSGTAPVVRLEGALALGHRCSPRLLAVPVVRTPPRPGRPDCRFSKLSTEPARSREPRSLPCRRRLGDCSRVLRTLPQVKPHRCGPAAAPPRTC